MEQVPKVYMAVTGGKLSKTNYYASTVIEQFEDYTARLCDEAVEEASAEAAESKLSALTAGGMVMVPAEPTGEMVAAAMERGAPFGVGALYKAMIAAATPDKLVAVPVIKEGE